MTETLLTVGEAVARIAAVSGRKVSRRVVQDWVDSGVVQGARRTPGGWRLLPMSVVDRLLAPSTDPTPQTR